MSRSRCGPRAAELDKAVEAAQRDLARQRQRRDRLGQHLHRVAHEIDLLAETGRHMDIEAPQLPCQQLEASEEIAAATAGHRRELDRFKTALAAAAAVDTATRLAPARQETRAGELLVLDEHVRVAGEFRPGRHAVDGPEPPA